MSEGTLKSPPPLWGRVREGAYKKPTEINRDVQVTRARALRQNLTEAEKKLWYQLRRRQIKNLKFRRQAPIGAYIADFVCYEPRLIIELDGGQHTENQAYDTKRNQWFESESFKVLRFWNHDIITNMEGVLQMIALTVDELSRCAASPSLTLPHKGGGDFKEQL